MSIPRPPKPGQSLAEKFPTVSAQWHPTRNGDLTPDQVSMSSHTRVWWQCGQGHEVEATVNNRTSNGPGCPVCAGKKVLTGYNDLTTTSPDVARQWHPTRNADRTPDQVSAGSNAKVWWRCDLGHEWEAEIKARASKGTAAPSVPGERCSPGTTTSPPAPPTLPPSGIPPATATSGRTRCPRARTRRCGGAARKATSGRRGSATAPPGATAAPSVPGGELPRHLGRVGKPAIRSCSTATPANLCTCSAGVAHTSRA